MKSTELIVLGLAGLAVYLIAKGGTASAKQAPRPASGTPGVRSVTDTVAEIFSSAGKTFDNGWRYFTDGTAIDPMGNYYFQGQKIWDNPSSSNWV